MERAEKWEVNEGSSDEPSTPAPAGYRAIGPWEPIGAWTASEDIQVGDNTQRIYSGVLWRRPLVEM